MARMRIGQEEDVEGHGLTVRDEEGNRVVHRRRSRQGDRLDQCLRRAGRGRRARLPARPRATSPRSRGTAGRWGLSDDPNVAYTIRFTDDDGQEQEVEGHAARFSDLRLKRDMQMIAGALERVHAIRPV